MAQGVGADDVNVVSRAPGDDWSVMRDGFGLGWAQACRLVEREMGMTVPQRVKSAWEEQWQTWANAQARLPTLGGTLGSTLDNLPAGLTSVRDQGDTVAG